MPFKDIEKRRAYGRCYHERNKSKIREYKKARYQLSKNDPEFVKKQREAKKRWYEREGIGYHRKWRLKRSFGLSVEDYNDLYDKQEGKCAICKGNEKNVSKYNLSVDHCHKTGRVRGLLCDACNLGLGKFNDSYELLDSAMKYLCKN